MPTYKTEAITASKLSKYLSDSSDFGFELRTLHDLIDLGFECDHSGTYTDPVTGKPRQFDIRATFCDGPRILRLAVECKHIRQFRPLLVSCVPRRFEEAFHEIVVSVDGKNALIMKPGGTVPTYEGRKSFFPEFAIRSQSLRVFPPNSIYSDSDVVGKACEQVGESISGELVGSDADAFAKWEQALCSADDLIYMARKDSEAAGRMTLGLAVPLAVVPDDRLWRAVYAPSGELIESPKLVDRCSYFVDRWYHHGEFESTISHIEFVTSRGLVELARHLQSNLRTYLPVTGINERFAPTRNTLEILNEKMLNDFE